MISNGGEEEEERSNLEIKDKWKNLMKKHDSSDPEQIFSTYLEEEEEDSDDCKKKFI